MSYNVGIPSVNASPALFPAQANTNFNRLLSIIQANHIFNLTSQSNDGIHKKMDMQNLNAIPVALVGDSILYTLSDGTNSQLHFYNAAGDTQLTPIETNFPERILFTNTYTTTGKFKVYPAQSSEYSGTLYAIISSGTSSGVFDYSNILSFGEVSDYHSLDNTFPGVNIYFSIDVEDAPSVGFVPGDVSITINSVLSPILPFNVTFSFIVNFFS